MTAMSHMDKRYWWVLLALLVLTACGGGGSDSDPQPAAVDRQSFTFRLTNLTANQPLSPAALVFHSDRIHLWAVGDSADAGLEVLAESGDPQPFIDGAAMQTAVAAALTGEGVIPPGGQDTIRFLDAAVRVGKMVQGHAYNAAGCLLVAHGEVFEFADTQ